MSCKGGNETYLLWQILSGSLVVVERLNSVFGTRVSKEAKERNKLICNPLMQHTPTLSFLHTTALVVGSKKVMLLLRIWWKQEFLLFCATQSGSVVTVVTPST